MGSQDDALRTADHPPLDAEQRREIEQRLLEERDRAQEDLNQALAEEEEPQADSSGDVSRLPSHMADAGSQADEADTDFRVAERNSERLTVIDEALRRLRDRPDAFGVCQECGEVIAMKRLRLVPWTRFCADHAPGS